MNTEREQKDGTIPLVHEDELALAKSCLRSRIALRPAKGEALFSRAPRLIYLCSRAPRLIYLCERGSYDARLDEEKSTATRDRRNSADSLFPHSSRLIRSCSASERAK